MEFFSPVSHAPHGGAVLIIPKPRYSLCEIRHAERAIISLSPPVSPFSKSPFMALPNHANSMDTLDKRLRDTGEQENA